MSDNRRDVNDLLDDLLHDAAVERRWELNPEQVLRDYEVSDAQAAALLEGNVDALIAEGLAERHVQQMRVSW